MSDISVAVIVGSLRRDSINRKVAQAVTRLNAPGLAFTFVEIGDQPLYNADFEAAPPPAVVAFRQAIAAAQAFLFVSPEYNRSVPGVLKNAIDIASKPNGHNGWGNKPGGLFGATPGAIGTAVMQSHLRTVMGGVGVTVFSGPEIYLTVKDGFFTENGDFNEGTQKFLQGWMDGYAAFVKKMVA
ncbi:NADPH-dependent FMN reductase [Asticcacaulis taihuensis]|uniref:NADPH-dependent FMN reductase n=1 Tax=Asticcacaulis taihuensis TaxID=260084 RepID=UPI003F7BBAD5